MFRRPGLLCRVSQRAALNRSWARVPMSARSSALSRHQTPPFCAHAALASNAAARAARKATRSNSRPIVRWPNASHPFPRVRTWIRYSNRCRLFARTRALYSSNCPNAFAHGPIIPATAAYAAARGLFSSTRSRAFAHGPGIPTDAACSLVHGPRIPATAPTRSRMDPLFQQLPPARLHMGLIFQHGWQFMLEYGLHV